MNALLATLLVCSYFVAVTVAMCKTMWRDAVRSRRCSAVLPKHVDEFGIVGYGTMHYAQESEAGVTIGLPVASLASV